MNLFALVASFGGGIIGAYMGALPEFILAGVIAIVGPVAAMVGGADMTVEFIVSGSYLGLHTAFVGGVAASAYAGRTKKLGSGTGTLSCLNGPTDPATLLVGGVFGVIGFFIHYLIRTVPHLNTDLPGFTVVLSAVVARLVFGSDGLIEKAVPGESKEYFTSGRGVLCNAVLGLGLRATTGFVYQVLLGGRASAVVISSYPVPCFGITAVSLISAQTGLAMPVTHHIALIPALAAVSSRNPVMGIVFGILTVLLGDFVRKIFNSCCDAHIDPPASTISVFTFIVNITFRGRLFSV